MKLILNWISPPCRAVCMLINALKMEVNYEEVDILTKRNYYDKLVKINPQHTVPVLEDEGHHIWDSHAISTYIVAKEGKEEQWYSKDLKKRALIDQRLHFESGLLYPALADSIKPILFQNKKGITWNDAHKIRKCYRFLNTFLEDNKFLCGQDVTLADLSCLATVSTLDLIYPVNEQCYPHLDRYLKDATELPYYRETNIIGLEKLCNELHARLIGKIQGDSEVIAHDEDISPTTTKHDVRQQP